MRIFLAGVSCVGKTTIGERLARLLEFHFFDLDIETERDCGMSVEHLRGRYLTAHGFRLAMSDALKGVLSRVDSCNCVIALPPSGLMGPLWKVVRRTSDATTVLLRDTPDNILRRITFYDAESRPIQKSLTDDDRRFYLGEIKRDIAYFGNSFRRADVSVDISGCSPQDAARRVCEALKPVPSADRTGASERRPAGMPAEVSGPQV